MNFHHPTNKWNLFYIRFTEDNSKVFACLRYISNPKRINYASFVRDMNETKSFYSWKLLIPEDNYI